jgi:hypothetical protein
MSKYDPLTKRLAAAKGDEWKTSFAELEKLLGAPLPKTAKSGKAWWKSDAATTQAKAWAGWEAEPGKDGVVFRKASVGAAAPSPESKAVAPVATGDETPPILKRLEVSPGWGMALVAGGVAVVAGLGALAFRAIGRKKA